MVKIIQSLKCQAWCAIEYRIDCRYRNAVHTECCSELLSLLWEKPVPITRNILKWCNKVGLGLRYEILCDLVSVLCVPDTEAFSHFVPPLVLGPTYRSSTTRTSYVVPFHRFTRWNRFETSEPTLAEICQSKCKIMHYKYELKISFISNWKKKIFIHFCSLLLLHHMLRCHSSERSINLFLLSYIFWLQKTARITRFIIVKNEWCRKK